MNVILPVENKMNLYRKLIYIIAIAVCVISIPLAVYFQYYKNKNTIKYLIYLYILTLLI